jgi:hypothetical protein
MKEDNRKSHITIQYGFKFVAYSLILLILFI